MHFETITYRIDGPLCFLSFNRPHRLNAVTQDLYRDVQSAITHAEKNNDVRVIVLSGEGRAFCVGADLKEHSSAERTLEQKRAYAQAEQTICEIIQKSEKPFVAAVNGYALGAGAEMALSCDFVIMKQSAEIGFPEISIGTYLGGGLTYVLPRLVGMAKAKELIFMGSRINGEEAERIGLIHKVVADEQFESEVRTFAIQLAEKAPISMSIAKSQLLSHQRIDEREALNNEADALLRCMETEDWKEGVRAFGEKRKPAFKGR